MKCQFNKCTNEAVLAFDGEEETDSMCSNCAEYRWYTQSISENGWSQEDCPLSVWRERRCRIFR